MAFSFASGDFVTIPYEGTVWPSFNVTPVWTVVYWMRTTSGTSNESTYSRSQSNSSFGYNMFFNNTANKLSTQFNGGAGQVGIMTGTKTINDGNWHHVALVSNGASGTLQSQYVDGVLDASTTTGGAFNSSAANTDGRLGKALDPFWGNYVGDLAEFAAWPFALTADEIAYLASGGLPWNVRPANTFSSLNPPAVYIPLWK